MKPRAVIAFAGVLLLAACNHASYTPSGRSTTSGATSHFYGAEGFVLKSMDLNYSWKGVPRCSNRLPTFTVGSVPSGTKELVFQLHNLSNSKQMHGGGTVPYRGKNTVRPSGHSYKGPCPASGSHQNFKWVVTALDQYGDSLAKGEKTASYPAN